MKKTLILMGMLAMGYVNAQTGKVGINTSTPNATMEITPLQVNSVDTATTNEGLIIPKLSKTRVANIETPVESTLVYVDNITYTSTTNATKNARVAEINTVGYYHYNGTKWVKGMGIDQMGATDGQVLKWNGTAWAPATDNVFDASLGSNMVDVGGIITSNLSCDATTENWVVAVSNGQVFECTKLYNEYIWYYYGKKQWLNRVDNRYYLKRPVIELVSDTCMYHEFYGGKGGCSEKTQMDKANHAWAIRLR